MLKLKLNDGTVKDLPDVVEVDYKIYGLSYRDPENRSYTVIEWARLESIEFKLKVTEEMQTASKHYLNARSDRHARNQ